MPKEGYVARMTAATTPITFAEHETSSAGARVRYLVGGDGDALILEERRVGKSVDQV